MRTARFVLACAVVLTGAPACFGGTIKPDAAALAAAPVPFPWAAWDKLLKKYVDGKGRVDYNAIDKGELEKVFAAVAASSPKKNPDKYASKSAQKAFYIDAYNVMVWKNVLTRLPKLKNVDSEKTSFFYFTNFALNCASGGCPQLPPEAFTPEKVDEQLSREARKFCNEKRNVDFDAATKKLKLSHIFDWYKEDFGKEPAKVIAWINNYRAADARLPDDAKIEYVDYDWTLNDLHLLNR